MPSLNRRTLLAFTGYAGFFLTCFVLSAFWTFPYERVRDLLVARAAESSSPPPKLSIGDIGPHFLTGVALTNVKLERAGATPAEPPTTIAIDKLSVRASPFAFLFGGVGVHFDAKAGSGELDGSYSAKKNGPSHTALELDAIDLDKLGLSGALGAPLRGAASGKVDLTLSEQTAETQGEIGLEIAGLQLGDGKAKIKIPSMGGLTLERIDAGKLELTVTIKEGIATISKLESKGKDLELSGSGSIRLLRPLMLSRADITLALKFDRAYTQRNDRTKAMFELMNANPLIKRAIGADGKIRFTLSGPLSSLNAVPAGPGAMPPAKARRGKHSE